MKPMRETFTIVANTSAVFVVSFYGDATDVASIGHDRQPVVAWRVETFTDERGAWSTYAVPIVPDGGDLKMVGDPWLLAYAGPPPVWRVPDDQTFENWDDVLIWARAELATTRPRKVS